MASNMDSEEKNESVIPGFNSVDEFTQKASKAIIQAIRSSHSLPTAGDDFDYYSSFDAFRRLMDMESSRLLEMMQEIMRYHGIKGNLSSTSQALELEDKFDVLVDANDQILERAGNYIDEASGIKKESPLVIASVTPKVSQRTASWNKKVGQLPNASTSKGASFRLLAAKNIQRPQLKFKDKVDNSYKPFIPKIKEKPNALKTLAESFTLPGTGDMDVDDNYSYPHPYKYELDHFTPPTVQVNTVTPQEPTATVKSTATMIVTEAGLEQLCKELKQQKEIAVDLEHHSYRSYLGFTCLMQISTRSQDYLIDTLELRNELHILNDVFTDPAIVKVFHGADSDIEWLQRDLGLYIVNMFDTGQASRVLGFARYSLSHLLKHYCSVEANKQFQLADWRIRPLPEELSRYAQEDTHYLLYIYDRMKNELISKGNENKNLLMSVIQRSTQICAKIYKKPQFSDEAHVEFYKKSKKLFHSQQMAALKGFYEWRDKIAREADESTGYILPNHMLMQIAELLPREPQGILACCNPIPPLVRQNLNELHHIIKGSRELPMHKVELSKPVSKPSMSQHPKYSVNSLLHCPHDNSHIGKEQQHVTNKPLDPGLVTVESSMFKGGSKTTTIVVRQSSTIEFFNSTKTKATSTTLTPGQRRADKIRAKFKSPFEKYLPRPKDESVPLETEDTLSLGLAESVDTWRLLPNTVIQPVDESVDASKQTTDTVDTSVNVGKGDAIKFMEEEEEEPEPIRYQLPKKRQQPQGEDDNQQHPLPSWDKRSKAISASSKKGQTSKPTVEEVEAQGFKPHDYSSTDYNKLFQDGPSKNSKGGKNRKNKHNKEYNPHQVEESYADVKKPKLSSGSSRKSMTYNKTKGQAPKIHWPKR